MTRYPEDEFDKAARERGPKGVHRPAEPAWKKFLPLLIALVLGPLLAWGLVSALNRDNEDPPVADGTEETTLSTDTATDAVTEPAVDPAAPTTEAPVETTPAEPAPEPEPVINYETTVTVYNGARVAGIAGRTADRVEAMGFTSTEALDYTAGEPTASTVYYATPDLADTAAAIGEELGIAQVVESADATDAIAVILRTDFQE